MSQSQTRMPLTFDLTQDLFDRLHHFQKKAGARTISEVVRYAASQFDFSSFQAVRRKHRQLSVRMPAEQRDVLDAISRQKRVSIGELLRAAVEALPAEPGNITLNQHKKSMATRTATKKTARKATAKKATKKVAKKAPAKKAAKKATRSR